MMAKVFLWKRIFNLWLRFIPFSSYWIFYRSPWLKSFKGNTKHRRFRNSNSWKSIDKWPWKWYNIALLKLSRPALLSHTVGLACLPNSNLMDRVTPRTKCFLTDKESWSISHFFLIIVVTMINYSHMRNKQSCRSPFNPNVFCLEWYISHLTFSARTYLKTKRNYPHLPR